MEDHDLVDTVDELWPEHPLQTFHCLRAHHFMLLISFILAFSRRETDTNGTLEFRTTGITGHDHHCILEVYSAALTIGQTTIIHNLQQSVEDLWMRLLNLVQQNDAVWASAHLFGQLTTFVVTDISWRATEQTSNGMRLHVLRHVKTDQVIFTTKEFSRQGLRQFRLTYTRWAKEEERANRALWILQAST